MECRGGHDCYPITGFLIYLPVCRIACWTLLASSAGRLAGRCSRKAICLAVFMCCWRAVCVSALPMSSGFRVWSRCVRLCGLAKSRCSTGCRAVSRSAHWSKVSFCMSLSNFCSSCSTGTRNIGAGLPRYSASKIGLPLQNPEKMRRLPPRARVAWRLLMLSEGYGPLSHARRLIVLEDIQAVECLALSPPALLEVLQDLHERKIVRIGEGQLEVFDVDKLRRVANFSKARTVC
ncbi:Cyclic nucleotide-binding protein [Pseudomonas savastanoi]|uniref:Cyclic nucleotide-binding protein n=1 Tax=Pseudomonas savastanoi TaxID=29438 RepID=A0A3M5GF95_PSESS|nr:Cyclic nucleotide-binding protein [Pseudomonas savastanoi]